MKTEAERTRIEELMNGTKRRDSEEKILFALRKIRSGVQNHHASDVAKMKRRLFSCCEGINHMGQQEAGQRTAAGLLHFQAQPVKGLCPRIALPCERPT